MYVDKTLTGLAAVQNLSRLNRTHPDKTGTFVLDFRNSWESIQESFAPWYVRTVAPPTDPHLLYDTHAELGPFDVLRGEEIETMVGLLLADPEKNHQRIHSVMQPAVDRFHALSEEQQDEFRGVLTRFTRVYSLLSQVVSFTDVKLERDYLFCRRLSQLVRGVRSWASTSATPSSSPTCGWRSRGRVRSNSTATLATSSRSPAAVAGRR